MILVFLNTICQYWEEARKGKDKPPVEACEM